MAEFHVETERLVLRDWRDSDREPFAAINADVEVMRHLGGPIERAASDDLQANAASWGLMIRLGMARREDMDFDHPAFAAGHPLRWHIVYAIDRPE